MLFLDYFKAISYIYIVFEILLIYHVHFNFKTEVLLKYILRQWISIVF